MTGTVVNTIDVERYVEGERQNMNITVHYTVMLYYVMYMYIYTRISASYAGEIVPLGSLGSKILVNRSRRTFGRSILCCPRFI